MTANSQQPTANSQQPTANSQQPTANSQQPTANSDFGFSPDALAERKAELLQLLGQTAPEIISDNQLNLNALKALLGDESIAPAEHYELSWAGKSAARREIQKTTSHTLLPDTNNPEHAQHMLIEGENLEVLRVLQKSYYGKVKMIYIDPPYNTGNDSFVYPDDYSETLDEYQKRTGEKNEQGFLNKQSLWKKNSKESGQYHSAWLSMMYPRLYLARNLLRDDGVIFISIDDNEQANLKLLCDEVFGADSFVTVLFIEMSATQGMKVKAAKDGNIVKNGEYILVYSKDGRKNIGSEPLYDYRDEYDTHYSKININNKPENLVDYFSKFSIENEKEIARIKKIYKNQRLDTLYKYSKVFYDFVDNNKERIFRFDKVTGFNREDYPLDQICKVERNGRAYHLYNNGNTLEQLLLLSDSFGLCDDFNVSYGLRKIRGDWWRDFYKDMGNVSKEGNTKFSNGKKPVRLIKQLTKFTTSSDDIVLDFFAGSGTTTHAVMELNTEDGGNRQSISVQMPEIIDKGHEDYIDGLNKITEITRSRIEKVIAKLKTEQPDKTADLACAHFKLAPSNFQVWRSDVADADALREQLAIFQQAEKPVNSQQAMLTELLLKNGLGALGVHAISKPKTLNCGMTIHRVLMDNDKILWLCFEPYQNAFKTEISQASPSQQPSQVILLNSCFANEKADEQISNLRLELDNLGIGLLII